MQARGVLLVSRMFRCFESWREVMLHERAAALRGEEWKEIRKLEVADQFQRLWHLHTSLQV